METQLENKNRIIALVYTSAIICLLCFFFMFVVFSNPLPTIKIPSEILIGSIEFAPSSIVNAKVITEAEKTKTDTKNNSPQIITDDLEKTLVIKTSTNNSTKLTTEEVIIEKKLNTQFQNALDRANKNTKNTNGLNLPVGNISSSNLPIDKNNVYVEGRKLIKAPSQIINSLEEGIVVVAIIVDEKGDVIKASPGQRGSTTANSNLFEKARLAALEAKFNLSKDGTKEQLGTYTFIFTLE